MRTTLTLNDNLLLTLKQKAAERNIPFKTMVNQTLQRGLEAMDKKTQYKGKYVTPTRSLNLTKGYDHDKLGQLPFRTYANISSLDRYSWFCKDNYKLQNI